MGREGRGAKLFQSFLQVELSRMWSISRLLESASGEDSTLGVRYGTRGRCGWVRSVE